MQKNKVIGLMALLLLSTLIWCSEKTSDENQELLIQETYPDWTDDTHSKGVDVNYDTVFPQDDVNRIDIVITEENWQAMMDDMESNYGEFWSSASGERGERPDNTQEQWDNQGIRPEWGNIAGGNFQEEEVSDNKPIYIESQVYFNDTQWYNVWMKLKGHSSLKTSWSTGVYKFPFKLDFDEFEDSYEELENQRFYGVKKLSFSSNFGDESLLHEKLATEMFSEAGLIAPETAFYRVYVDYGEGSQYFGLYTAVEVIDDTVIDKFWDDSWNVYEAEWKWVTLAEDTYDQISTHYEKKTNEEEADWSDVQELSTVLNSDLRLIDSQSWKDNLEEIFDVDVFLTWLAVNGTIQNWDTYGVMTHNFYLYDNPETGKLTWIPWDNNESFSEWKKGLVGLTANGTGDDWPLIRYILDDEEYRAQYIENVHEFNDTIFSKEALTERIEQLHDMIAPYVVWNDGEQEGYTLLKNASSFTGSVNTLLTYIQGRIEAAADLSLDDDWEYDASNITERWAGWFGGERPARPEGTEWEFLDFPERVEWERPERPDFINQ